MTATAVSAKTGSRIGERQIKAAFTLMTAVPLLVFVLYPLWAILKKSFILKDGSWGLDNYAHYFTEPKFIAIITNSFSVSISRLRFSVTPRSSRG